MKWKIATVVFCLVLIAGALADVRCSVPYARSNSVLVACSAGRLP